MKKEPSGHLQLPSLTLLFHVRRRLDERTATPSITPTVKLDGGSFISRALPIAPSGIYTRGKANWIRFAGTRLVTERFVLMQDNDPKYTNKLYQSYIKIKEEQHILQIMSLPVQSVESNTIELVWDELDRKVNAKQPRSAGHLWQLLQESWAELFSVYLQSLLKRMPKICE